MGSTPILPTKKEDMSLEKERYNTKLNDIRNEIQLKQSQIYQLEHDIRDLKRSSENACNHKLDNGKSAMVEKRGWVSNVSDSYNDWTGETEQHDSGYTNYYNVCQICNYSDDEE